MIGEFVLDIVFNIVSSFFAFVPVEWTVDTSVFEFAGDVLAVIAYLLPWEHVVAIVSLIFAVTLFRCAVSLGVTIWDLLPFA